MDDPPIHYLGWGGFRGGLGGKGGEGGKGGQGMTGCCVWGAALWVRVCLPAIAVEPRLFFLGCECDNRLKPSSRLSCQIDLGQGDASITPQEVL